MEEQRDHRIPRWEKMEGARRRCEGRRGGALGCSIPNTDGIWSGLMPYRLRFDTLSEYQESCEYGRLLLLAVAPAGLDPPRPLGGLGDGEEPLGGEVEDQHANGDILCNNESKEEGVKGGEHSDIKDHMVALVLLHSEVTLHVILHSKVTLHVLLHSKVTLQVILHSKVTLHMLLHSKVTLNVILHSKVTLHVILHSKVTLHMILYAKVTLQVLLHSVVTLHVLLHSKVTLHMPLHSKVTLHVKLHFQGSLFYT